MKTKGERYVVSVTSSGSCDEEERLNYLYHSGKLTITEYIQQLGQLKSNLEETRQTIEVLRSKFSIKGSRGKRPIVGLRIISNDEEQEVG